MKNLIYILLVLFTGTGALQAATYEHNPLRGDYYNGQRYIFMQDGIEFSVYPDGEFDFVVPQVISGLNINFSAGPVNISYNSGFNYDAYVQYDQYGAVIQIGNVPIYYDNWGRIVQAGDIYLNYSNARLIRLGGMNIYYNGVNFAYTRGYINLYNRNFRPGFYADYLYRPYVDRCLVYNIPYRRYYNPKRYSYVYHRDHYLQGYRNGYANAYHDFKRPKGQIAHNSGRSGSYSQARRNAIPQNVGATRTSQHSTARIAAASSRESERNSARTSNNRSAHTAVAKGRDSKAEYPTRSRSVRNDQSRHTVTRTPDKVISGRTAARARSTNTRTMTGSSRQAAPAQRTPSRTPQQTHTSRSQTTRSASPARSTTRSSRSSTEPRGGRGGR